MFISKGQLNHLTNELDSLRSRMTDLENRVKYAETFALDQFDEKYISSGYSMGFMARVYRTVSMQSAIKNITNYLGIELKQTDAIPSKVEVVKHGKK